MATGLPRTRWNGDNEFDGVPATPIALAYEGKQTEEAILATEAGQFELLYQQSEASQKRLYYGDNLPVLSALLQDATICGQVRLIYIDPPFATGSVFQSRSQKNAYTDLVSGTSYIEFMRQRLIFLRELLADDGSIYVHLDSNMAFYIKVVMDEIFGARNFRNWITRKKCNPKNYTRKTYGNISDYILFYTKSDNYVWYRPYESWTPEDVTKEYQYVEKETGRRYKKVPVHASGVRYGATGGSWRGMKPPPGKHWQYTPEKLDEMDARGEIYWSPNGNPRRKIYLDNSLGKPVQDIWLDFRDAHNQNVRITGYPTEKNPDLIARIIEASSNAGDIVLDCFAGSGTTLVKAEELGRKWIGVDNSPQAIATTLMRYAIGTQPMGDFVSDRRDSKEKPSPTQLSFLNDDTPSEGGEPNKVYPITDFSLFCLVGESDDLVGVLREWRQLLSAHRHKNR